MIGRRLSHFRILDRVGEGGMGVVYRAQDENLHRVVALKVLPPERLADEERRLRFLREARAAAAVTHPNIAVVYEVDESNGTVFIAMELIEGKSLRAAIGGRPLALKEALRLGVEIAEGLSAAHHARLVHRDLKPDNVMVNREGRVKILDFGLAKLLEQREEPAPGAESKLATISDEMTQAGRVLGTAAYMSPEQIRGQSVDTRSDVFAFGLVMYEMATGASPFQGATSMDIMSAILHKETPPPSQVNAEVPPELERIIRKCIEKDPAERYQDTRDLVVDLRRLKKDTDSGAASRLPVTGESEAIEPARSRPLATVLLGAGIALVLVAAGLGAWRFWPRAPKAGTLTQRLLLSAEELGGQFSGGLSPDGKFLVLSSGGGLSVREVATGATRDFPPPEGMIVSFARWSPDGTQIYAAVGSQSRNSSIWVVSALTGTFRKLGEAVSGGPWPSPDGKLLAFVPPGKGPGPGNGLWVMSSDGQSPRKVVSLDGEDDRMFRVAWAPNSRWLAFLPRRGSLALAGELTIEISDLAGKRTQVLRSEPRLRAGYGQVSTLCWLPDGRLLYSLSEPPPKVNDMNLWGVPVDLTTGRSAGEPARITNETGVSINVVGVSADGSRLLAYKSAAQRHTFVGNLSQDGARLSDVRRLTLSKANDEPEGWTRDGRVILLSDRNGTGNIFMQALDSREPAILIAGPQDVVRARTSPDGKLLLYGTRGRKPGAADGWTLMSLDVVSGTVRSMGAMTDGTELECPSRAGAPCVLGNVGTQGIVLSLFDPETGKGREFFRLPRPGQIFNTSWDVSPDGGRLVLVTTDSSFKPKVRIVEVPGGQVREIALKGVEWVRHAAFAANGKSLFVSGRTREDGHLLRVELDGRTTVLRRDDSAGEWPERLVPSRDGRYLAFEVESLTQDLWLIEGI